MRSKTLCTRTYMEIGGEIFPGHKLEYIASITLCVMDENCTCVCVCVCKKERKCVCVCVSSLCLCECLRICVRFAFLSV